MVIDNNNIPCSKVYAEEQEKDHSKSKRRDRSNLAIRRDSAPLELPTEKLLRWRRAAKDAMSASQLALCMCELERCIAWEKSTTIVVSLESLSLFPSLSPLPPSLPPSNFHFCLCSSVKPVTVVRMRTSSFSVMDVTREPTLTVARYACIRVCNSWWLYYTPPFFHLWSLPHHFISILVYVHVLQAKN